MLAALVWGTLAATFVVPLALGAPVLDALGWLGAGMAAWIAVLFPRWFRRHALPGERRRHALLRVVWGDLPSRLRQRP